MKNTFKNKRINKNRVRPIKKLIPILRARLHPQTKACPIQERRQRFLTYMAQKHHIACTNMWAWSGVGLDFLEHTKTITPGMHSAAQVYFKFSKSILSDAPKQAKMRYEDPALRGKKISSQQDDAQNAAQEKHWKEMCSILDHHQMKNVVDKLRSDQDLPCLETLFSAEKSLNKLKESLVDIENYLHSVKDWRTTS